jgi:hypothetical protein
MHIVINARGGDHLAGVGLEKEACASQRGKMPAFPLLVAAAMGEAIYAIHSVAEEMASNKSSIVYAAFQLRKA